MKILLVGAKGRMGQAISENAPQFGIEIIAGVDRDTTSYSYPIYADIKDVKEHVEAIVDFSHASMVKETGAYANAKGLPVVFGATGLTEEDLAYIERLSQNIPVLQSSNMSLGIQVLKLLSEKASKILGNLYDIEIIERHHNQKKDAPSGTALLLLDAVKQKDSEPIFGRHGADVQRKKTEIGLHAVRGGGVPGEHEVGFYGAYDELFLTHRARDRKVFALGALEAIRFLSTKKSGRYDTYNLIKELLRD